MRWLYIFIWSLVVSCNDVISLRGAANWSSGENLMLFTHAAIDAESYEEASQDSCNGTVRGLWGPEKLNQSPYSFKFIVQCIFNNSIQPGRTGMICLFKILQLCMLRADDEKRKYGEQLGLLNPQRFAFGFLGPEFNLILDELQFAGLSQQQRCCQSTVVL